MTVDAGQSGEAQLLPDTVVFDFGGQAFDDLVAACERDILWTFIRARVRPRAAVLEAGAGSGRWVKFLADQGYDARGVELSRADVDRFRERHPQIAYELGDIRSLPYADARFDAVLSLGVFEHMIDGPGAAASEMFRVLKPGGLAFFTVPHANLLFTIERFVDRLRFPLFRSHIARRLLSRPPLTYARAAEKARLREVARRRIDGLPIKYSFDPARGATFYEYRYRTQQAERLLTAAGFEVASAHHLYSLDRIHQLFGRIAVIERPELRPNALGRLLLAALPQNWISHMVLVIARKP
jgi:SAM-dependent methyltransferase